MPSDYTGDPSGVAEALPVISCPVGTDPANAASVNNPLQALADYAAKLWAGWQPNVGAAARALLKTISNNQTGQKTRLYVKADGTLEVTFGCAWNEAESRWDADAGSVLAFSRVLNCGRFRMVLDPGGSAGFFYDRPYSASASYWSDAAGSWETVSLSGAGLGFSNVKTDAFGSNPPASTALLNVLTAKAIPKAYGQVWTEGAGGVPVPTLKSGLNVKSVTNEVGDPGPRITLGTPMAEDDFVVELTDCTKLAGGSANGAGGQPFVFAQSKDGGADGCAYFVVSYDSYEGTPAAPVSQPMGGAGDRFGFSFTVYGAQAG